MTTLFLGDRPWLGRAVAGLVILGYAGYRLAAHKPDSLAVVAALLGLAMIVFTVWSAHKPAPVPVEKW